ncbi:hypothetical protein S83_017019 [Arachis hypogaea]
MKGSSVMGDPVTPPPPMAGKKAAPVTEEDDARSKYGEMMEMKLVVRHKDLKEIVEAIKESFDKGGWLCSMVTVVDLSGGGGVSQRQRRDGG